jgi:hemolysin-activating ACP:hemolysin acyltransferase
MTSTETTASDLGRQFLQSVDKSYIGAAASKLFSASIGDIVMILSRSPAHKHYSLADIEWMVLPAVMAGQFYVVEAAHKERGFRVPTAVVTWAFVSEAVDTRLREQAGRCVRLRPDEWKNGEIAWLIDAAGSAEGTDAALRWLLAGPLKQQSIKAIVRDTEGVNGVGTLNLETMPTVTRAKT